MGAKYEKKDWHKSPDARKRLGVSGEDTACRYIEGLGMQIIERNKRYRLGELDIVALDSDSICFIEVKTRKTLRFGRPSEALTKQKRLTLLRLTEMYLKEHKEYCNLKPRIDVIEVLVLKSGTYINHIKAAF